MFFLLYFSQKMKFQDSCEWVNWSSSLFSTTWEEKIVSYAAKEYETL